jgi:hypothetical protein
MEFIVEIPSSISKVAVENAPREFEITPNTLANIDPNIMAIIPPFKITGRLHRSKVIILLPLSFHQNLQAYIIILIPLVFNWNAIHRRTDCRKL